MNTNNLTELEVLDLDEPSPTATRLSRVDNPEDDLEKRLAWLAQEVRTTSAEHAKKKRQETVLEAREYKTAPVPVSTNPPKDVDLPKVTLAVGVVPQRDPTLVGRRTSENEWEFDVSDPEELTRTLPLDPHASVPDPLPFHSPTPAKAPARHRTFVVALGILGGVFLGAFLHQSLARSSHEYAYANVSQLHRGVDQAARDAEVRYHAWEKVRSLLAPSVTPNQCEEKPAASASVPSASGSGIFRWVKPIPSAAPKPTGSARVFTPAQEKARRSIYEDIGF